MTATTYVAGPLELVECHDLRDALSAENGFQSFLERDVVIRRMRGDAADSPRARSRFITEVKALAALSHHSFIRVFDAGIQGDAPFAVVERLRGITAQHRLDLLADRGKRMALDEAVQIVRNVADGVEHARRQGVRVYDISPGNIVLAEDRRVVLTGLGQPLPDNHLAASATALAYAAPERLFGAPWGQEGDVYSLGVLLAHLVFGRLPFEGTAVSVLAQKQESGSLPILEDGQMALGCPYPLAAVIHRATSAEPAERFGGVEAFVTALLDSVGGRPARAVAPPRHDVHRSAHGSGFALHPLTNQGYTEPLWPSRSEQEELRFVLRPETTATRPTPQEHLAARHSVPPQPVEARPDPSQTAVTQPLPPQPIEDVVLPGALGGYDPLMPGLDNPALAAALPYTILVPMPEGAEALEAPPSPISLRQSFLTPAHLAVLMVLSALAISAALMFG